MAQVLDDTSIVFERLIRDNWGKPPSPPDDDNGRGGGGDGGDDDEPLSLHQKICLVIGMGAFLICVMTAAYIMFPPA